MRSREWSPVEVQYLKERYGNVALSQLSIELGRSERAITSAAKKLGTVEGAAVTAASSLSPTKSHQGLRPDLGISFRSSWEANLARYLTSIRVKWLYEPKTFTFPAEVRGSRTYTPDFYLPETDLWLEVKGHLNSQGRSKLKKFRKYYPETFAKLRAVPGTNKSPSAMWFAENGVPIFAFYNVLRFDQALRLPCWEHDSVSERWSTSTRKRSRPDDSVILPAPRERRKKGTKIGDETRTSSPRSGATRVYTKRPSERASPSSSSKKSSRGPQKRSLLHVRRARGHCVCRKPCRGW